MPPNWPDRIEWIASTFEDGNLRALGRRIGVTGQAVSAWTRGEARPAGEALSALARTYPGLNCRWLLTGRGEPLIDGLAPSGPFVDGDGASPRSLDGGSSSGALRDGQH
ncbi:MAG TPA: helix-turn-helix transcriptional regulator [Gemmatimonadota bacterium]|nr:helix-turn-helix transcriptional regulator [Gemmatimonadota bacterium]